MKRGRAQGEAYLDPRNDPLRVKVEQHVGELVATMRGLCDVDEATARDAAVTIVHLETAELWCMRTITTARRHDVN